MLRFEMLPAEFGDSLLLEYGKASAPQYRILVDGGTSTAYAGVRERLLQIPTNRAGKRRLELLIITHVDGDHIEGTIKMLQDEELALDLGDVWFNDWNHVKPLVASEPPTHLGPEQGEFVGALLLRQDLPWNKAFNGAAVVQPLAPEKLPMRLVKGMKLTVVSPTVDTLIRLRATWKQAIQAAGFQPGSPEEALKQFASRRWAKAPGPTHLGTGQPKTLDHAPANGSSIAVIAEYGGRRVLLGADAFADVLRPAIERWRDESPATRSRRGRVPFDAFKLAHHGSKNNISDQLMNVISSPTYLVSTNGQHFHHPDVSAITQVIEGHAGPKPPVLRFNYRTNQTKVWARREDVVARYGEDSTVEWKTKH